MKERIINILKYFILWLVFFQLARVFFLIITYRFSTNYSFFILLNSMINGIWLDASVSGYFTLLFTVFNITGIFIPKFSKKIFTICNYFFIIVSGVIITGNAILYTFWATPLDINALRYLKNPNEAVASINWLKIIIPVITGFLLTFSFIYFSKKTKIKIIGSTEASFSGVLKSVLLNVFIAFVLVIPVRGGIGIVPINLSKVYFYKEIYPNHAAYNPVWNVFYSFTNTSNQNYYKFMDNGIAETKFKTLFTQKNELKDDEKLINASKPNIIIIVLESYLQKLFYYKYNNKEVIPNLNKIASESVMFTQYYSTGDRSDRGLVAIFSGYPAMPKSAIVQFPDKFTKLPSLFKDFAKYNYKTSFYYGGNLDFANLRSYFISAGVDKIIGENDFNGKLLKGKWGVHDEFTFNRLFNDLKNEKQAFFTSIFTLSNHEPFDLPEKYYFGNENGDQEYMSAAKYTDTHIGNFIDSLKKSKIWDNTLVVITADHGVARLGINEMQIPEKFHIPLIWTGGVLKKSKKIDKICSQTDFPLMLLDQCGIAPKKKYKFSNSVFRNGSIPFATYFFNNGFGFLSRNCISIFDNVSKKYWTNTCPQDKNGDLGKAFLQVLSNDFNK